MFVLPHVEGVNKENIFNKLLRSLVDVGDEESWTDAVSFFGAFSLAWPHRHPKLASLQTAVENLNAL